MIFRIGQEECRGCAALKAENDRLLKLLERFVDIVIPKPEADEVKITPAFPRFIKDDEKNEITEEIPYGAG